MKIRVLICGSRYFENYNVFEYCVTNCLKEKSFDDIEIVSGGAKGADSLAKQYAQRHSIEFKEFKADWANNGKAAGPIRNKKMLEYLKEVDNNLVIAFTNSGSKGTKNTISQAKKLGIICEVFDCEVNQETLTEGVRLDGQISIFDWDSDYDSDIINLTKVRTKITKFNHNLYYYGYYVNKNSDKDDRLKVLKSIKNIDSRKDIDMMIDRSVDSFFKNCPVAEFDHIIESPSTSNLNKLIVDNIKSRYDKNIDVLTSAKCDISKIELDWESIWKNFDKYDHNKVEQFFNRLLRNSFENGLFKVSKIPSQYRRYFKSSVDLDISDIDVDSNILILDDIKTSGYTINSIIDRLNSLGFKGTIIIFTLIRN